MVLFFCVALLQTRYIGSMIRVSTDKRPVLTHGRLLIIIAFLWLALVWPVGPAMGQGMVESCELANKDITESSGLAFSTRRPDILWTHNDSGGGPFLYAFDLNCRNRGVFELKGVRAWDWEDLAAVKINGQSYLLIADTGDNAQHKKAYAIHMVKEPVLSDSKPVKPVDIRVYKTIQFRYQDKSHNCEAIAVDPTDKSIFLITKSNGLNGQLYFLPVSEQSPDRVNTAYRITTFFSTPVTAMDISRDGKRAVVITYGDGFEFQREDGETWSKAFQNKPKVIALPHRRQGESVCYGPDSKSIYLTSEKRPTPLWVIDRK